MGGVDEEGSGKARGMEGPTWSTQTYRFICCVGSGTWLSLSKLSDPTEEKQQFGVSQRQKRVTVVVAILTNEYLECTNMSFDQNRKGSCMLVFSGTECLLTSLYITATIPEVRCDR